MKKTVKSPIAMLLIVLLSAAILGWLAYSQSGTVPETIKAGSEGIRKAQEIKLQLEAPLDPNSL